MFYAVYYNDTLGKVLGFIVDDENVPIQYESEKDAEDQLKGHPLYEAGLVEIIEI